MNSTLLAPAAPVPASAPASAVVAAALPSAAAGSGGPSLFALLMDGLPASDGELTTDTAAPDATSADSTAPVMASALPFVPPPLPSASAPVPAAETAATPSGAGAGLEPAAGLPPPGTQPAALAPLARGAAPAPAASVALAATALPVMAGSLLAANVGRNGGASSDGSSPVAGSSSEAAAPLAADAAVGTPQPAEPRLLAGGMAALPVPAHELGQRPAAAAAVPEWAPLPVDDGSASAQGGALHQLLAQRLAVQSSHGIDRALIRLDPPSFGSLEIALRHEGGHLTVQLTASNGDMARQLQGIGELLRQELGNRQFQSVQLEVRHGAGDGQGGQQQGRREPEQQATPGRALQLAAEDDGFGLASYQAGAEA
ncbi:flagellar hook-length control protein FliK [Vogesella indigofera]|uniref:flagellar hook-length control protein FliK n=1 Tax=Vogesella indigofera TaxID=45465 RepID=UPI00234ECCC7|nr:flagellar hook-length control protein FliK [Vogesella indigofera]MDC7706131.1 flagellar hook-length control protein FliK [Vogesella indigofera]